MSPSELTVKLDKYSYRGDTLGRSPDGRVVFVPFALPGETVRLRVVEEKRSHLRAELIEVLEASPKRIKPKCIHFGECGGCHYQHLSYESQLSVKTEIMRDQLIRIGKLENIPLHSIVPSPMAWNYRNHIQFHLADDGKLGFVREDGSILRISECHLPEAMLNEIWPGLVIEPGLHMERLSLRLGMEGEAMLVLESPEPPELELEAGLSVVHLMEDEAVVMAGDYYLVMLVNGKPFRVSAGAFFQVNTPMAEKMVSHLLEHLPVTPGTVMLDIYCGVGLFSAFFAGKVGRLIGIEASPAACEDFTANLDEFDNVELYQAPAEDILPQLDVHPDIVIVDPPRSGLEKKGLEALLALGPERIAYVSCDPSTLARDAARMIAVGYRLLEVTPFDLFPQTYHIESISLFERKSLTKGL
jgi:23S rRNA (uracil1939-C5)-methyltransferase